MRRQTRKKAAQPAAGGSFWKNCAQKSVKTQWRPSHEAAVVPLSLQPLRLYASWHVQHAV